MQSYYLKGNIAIEPLVARYRSSSYLVSPCSAPRYLRHLIKRLLASFVKSPRAHELALKNEKMQGGIFVGLSSDQKVQAEMLLDFQNNDLIALFQVADLQDELSQQLKLAVGEPLDEFMHNNTGVLEGLLEFYYTRSGHASYRMIEGLLYKSHVYRESIQEIALYPILSDARSFALTTPRLPNKFTCFLKIPHRWYALDQLARTRTNGITNLDFLAKSLRVNSEDMELFYSFFEKTSTKHNFFDQYDVADQSHVRTRYFGHACVEVSSGKTTILVDPLISYSIPDKKDQRLTFSDLPEQIDAVVITHLHLDHFCVETLLQLRHKVSAIIIPKTNGGSAVDPSGKWILRAMGFNNIIELDSTEHYQCGDLTITSLPFPGEHGCLDITCKSIFNIRSASTSLIFAADIRTSDKALVQHMAKIVGKLDTLFLGMEAEGAPASWLYGPLLDEKVDRQWDQKRRLNGSNAELGLQMINLFNPKKVRIYALGREPWLSHLMRVDASLDSIGQQEINILTKRCEELGIDIKTLHLHSVEFYESSSEKVFNY